MSADDPVRSADGLTADQADRLLSRYGPNTLPRSPSPGLINRVFGQLKDPMILLLMGAGVVTTAVGNVTDTAVIVAVVLLNTSVGVRQEVRAGSAIAALSELSAPRATVVRSGHEIDVPAERVVPGDLLRLDAGDVVPADAHVLEAHRLQLDESAITGESVPVDRGSGDEVVAGSVLTNGRGTAVVTRTGEHSGLGQVAALIASAPRRPTPLQQRLAGLSRMLVVVTLGLSAVVLGLGLLQGRGLVEMLVLAVSLAVAAVPESLPAVVTVALALGAHRMAGRSAIVRWLPAVETLGSVSVIASDKTGTLTEGRMVAERLWTPTDSYAATGTGYSPDEGTLSGAGRSGQRPDDLYRLLRNVVLCSDARLLRLGAEWTVLGDPLEGAMLAVAAKGGVDAEPLRREWPRVSEIPFDAERRRMITQHRDGRGRCLTICKGAPEVVLALATDTDETSLVAASQAVQRLTAAGYRLIAVADRQDPTGVSLSPEHELRLAGLVAVADPPRTSALEVVDACRAAGVRLLLVTGDHPATARAIADRLGIGAGEVEVATGDDLADGGYSGDLDDVGVYARTRPEQKVDIVEAWQRRGHVVAMTGDGVNDAPALRRADIGVAMGRGGTEVARQAAALVLADDDLRTVVVAIEEGRRIFANIRSFLRYALSGGFAEVAVLLLAPFLGVPAPLLPAQILWINMLTHGLPGVAFAGEPLDPAVMHQPSRSPQRSVLGDGLARAIVLTGSAITTVTLVAALIGADRGNVQTWVFVTLGLSQLGVALALRAPRSEGGIRSRGLELAVAGAVVLQVAPIWLSPLQTLLGTAALDLSELAVITGLAALPGLAVRLHRRQQRRASPPRPASVCS